MQMTQGRQACDIGSAGGFRSVKGRLSAARAHGAGNRTSMRSSMAGLARPVRTVEKLRFTASRLLSMRSICALVRTFHSGPSGCSLWLALLGVRLPR